MKPYPCVAAAAAALGTLLIVGPGSGATSRSIPLSGHHVTVNLKALGVEFTPELPPATAISAQAAVHSALRFSLTETADGGVSQGVVVNALYGTFTDLEYEGEQPSGALLPLYRNVPVWVVTFSGKTVGLPNLGPMEGTPLPNRSGGVRRRDLVVNNESVIVDGRTGAALETLD